MLLHEARFSMHLIAISVLMVGMIPGSHSALMEPVSHPNRIVALDPDSLKLLHDCCPDVTVEALIQTHHEPLSVLMDRAWSMRNARCLFYRSDTLSNESRLFRERLQTQGVPTMDLAPYANDSKTTFGISRFASRDRPHSSDVASDRIVSTIRLILASND